MSPRITQPRQTTAAYRPDLPSRCATGGISNDPGTRKEELLKDEEELRLTHILHRVLADMHPVEAMELLLKQLGKHKTNTEFLTSVTLG